MNSSISFCRILFLLLITSGFARPALATLTDGALSPDFTLTDINGNTFNLYQQLESGKTVFLEFVAAWDENCWNYHHAQHLQSLYALHGPSGTCSDDVIVVLIEADLTSGLDVLDGSSSISAGNWISDTPYPIFNPSSDAIIEDFLITSFPTIYRICPSKIVRSNGQVSTTTHVASIDACSITNDVGIREDAPFYYCNGSVVPKVVIHNFAYPLSLQQAEITWAIDGVEQSPITWNGSIDPGTEELYSLPQIALTAGIHEISCSLVNLAPNSFDLNEANNCLKFILYVGESVFNVIDVNQDFSDPEFPYSAWVADNPDLSNGWEFTSHEGGMMMLDFFTYGDVNEVDVLFAGPVDFQNAAAAYLSFDVAYAPYSDSLFDGLGVAVSSDCGETWSDVFYKEGQELATSMPLTEPFLPYPGLWRSECIDLSAFTGSESLLVSFIGFNGWGNNLYLDNVGFGSSCVVDIPVVATALNDLVVFPNPASHEIHLMGELSAKNIVQCTLHDLTGKIAAAWNTSQLSIGNVTTLDCSALPGGVYTLRVNCEDSVFSTKVTVVR